MYSGIVSDVASHGYVVACVEHRDRSAGCSFQRVPRPGSGGGGASGGEGPQQLQDDWIEYEIHTTPEPKREPIANAEQEFPLRNKQVGKGVWL